VLSEFYHVTVSVLALLDISLDIFPDVLLSYRAMNQEYMPGRGIFALLCSPYFIAFFLLHLTLCRPNRSPDALHLA